MMSEEQHTNVQFYYHVAAPVEDVLRLHFPGGVVAIVPGILQSSHGKPDWSVRVEDVGAAHPRGSLYMIGEGQV